MKWPEDLADGESVAKRNGLRCAKKDAALGVINLVLFVVVSLPGIID